MSGLFVDHVSSECQWRHAIAEEENRNWRLKDWTYKLTSIGLSFRDPGKQKNRSHRFSIRTLRHCCVIAWLQRKASNPEFKVIPFQYNRLDIPPRRFAIRNHSVELKFDALHDRGTTLIGFGDERRTLKITSEPWAHMRHSGCSAYNQAQQT